MDRHAPRNDRLRLKICALSIVCSMPALAAIRRARQRLIARFVQRLNSSGGCPEGTPDVWARGRRQPFWRNGSGASGDFVPAGVAQAFAFKSLRNGAPPVTCRALASLSKWATTVSSLMWRRTWLHLGAL